MFLINKNHFKYLLLKKTYIKTQILTLASSCQSIRFFATPSSFGEVKASGTNLNHTWVKVRAAVNAWRWLPRSRWLHLRWLAKPNQCAGLALPNQCLSLRDTEGCTYVQAVNANKQRNNLSKKNRNKSIYKFNSESYEFKRKKTILHYLLSRLLNYKAVTLLSQFPTSSNSSLDSFVGRVEGLEGWQSKEPRLTSSLVGSLLSPWLLAAPKAARTCKRLGFAKAPNVRADQSVLAARASLWQSQARASRNGVTVVGGGLRQTEGATKPMLALTPKGALASLTRSERARAKPMLPTGELEKNFLLNSLPYSKSFLCYWLLPFAGFVFSSSLILNFNKKFNENTFNATPLNFITSFTQSAVLSSAKNQSPQYSLGQQIERQRFPSVSRSQALVAPWAARTCKRSEQPMPFASRYRKEALVASSIVGYPEGVIKTKGQVNQDYRYSETALGNTSLTLSKNLINMFSREEILYLMTKKSSHISFENIIKDYNNLYLYTLENYIKINKHDSSSPSVWLPRRGYQALVWQSQAPKGVRAAKEIIKPPLVFASRKSNQGLLRLHERAALHVRASEDKLYKTQFKNIWLNLNMIKLNMSINNDLKKQPGLVPGARSLDSQRLQVHALEVPIQSPPVWHWLRQRQQASFRLANFVNNYYVLNKSSFVQTAYNGTANPILNFFKASFLLDEFTKKQLLHFKNYNTANNWLVVDEYLKQNSFGLSSETSLVSDATKHKNNFVTKNYPRPSLARTCSVGSLARACRAAKHPAFALSQSEWFANGVRGGYTYGVDAGTYVQAQKCNLLNLFGNTTNNSENILINYEYFNNSDKQSKKSEFSFAKSKFSKQRLYKLVLNNLRKSFKDVINNDFKTNESKTLLTLPKNIRISSITWLKVLSKQNYLTNNSNIRKTIKPYVNYETTRSFSFLSKSPEFKLNSTEPEVFKLSIKSIKNKNFSGSSLHALGIGPLVASNQGLLRDSAKLRLVLWQSQAATPEVVGLVAPSDSRSEQPTTVTPFREARAWLCQSEARATKPMPTHVRATKSKVSQLGVDGVNAKEPTAKLTSEKALENQKGTNVDSFNQVFTLKSNQHLYYSTFIKTYKSKLAKLTSENLNSLLLKQKQHFKNVMLINQLKSSSLNLNNYNLTNQRKYVSNKFRNNKLEKVIRAYFSIKNKLLQKKSKNSNLNQNFHNLNYKRKFNFYKILKNELNLKLKINNLSPSFDQTISKSSFSASTPMLFKQATLAQATPRSLIKNRAFILNGENSLQNKIKLIKSAHDAGKEEIPLFNNINKFSTAFLQKEKFATNFLLTDNLDNNIVRVMPTTIEQQRKTIQKKRRRKKLKKETRRRKKRKRFYPRPTWLRYSVFVKFINKRKIFSLKRTNTFSNNSKSKLFVKFLIHKPLTQNNKRSLTDLVKNRLQVKPNKYQSYQEKNSLLMPFSFTKENFAISYNLNTSSGMSSYENTETGVYSNPLASNNNSLEFKSEFGKGLAGSLRERRELTNQSSKREVPSGFNKVLLKSYWLRTNLNPYLKRVKHILTQMKEPLQKWQLTNDLKALLNGIGGFTINKQNLNTVSNSYLTNNSIKFQNNSNFSNVWENTLYYAEHNRVTYLRIEEFISQIRENFATLINHSSNLSSINTTKSRYTGNTINKKLKVRSCHVNHLKLQHHKREEIMTKRRTTDFWVKLGKTIMTDNNSGLKFTDYTTKHTYFNANVQNQGNNQLDDVVQSTIPPILKQNASLLGFSFPKQNPNIARLRTIWALSKTTPYLNLESAVAGPSLSTVDQINKSKPNLNSTLYKRKQIWVASPESVKFREQTKYNKTKKMLRQLSIKIQTLLNEQTELIKRTFTLKLTPPAQVNTPVESIGLAAIRDPSPARSAWRSQTLTVNLDPNINAGSAIKTNTGKGNNISYKEEVYPGNGLVFKLFNKTRQKEEKYKFINNHSLNKLMLSKYQIREFKKSLQNRNLLLSNTSKANANYERNNKTRTQLKINSMWLTNLTNKSSYWWSVSSRKTKNPFSQQSQRKKRNKHQFLWFLEKPTFTHKYPIGINSSSEKDNLSFLNESNIQIGSRSLHVRAEQKQKLFFTIFISTLIFHFCTVVTLLSISQIRGVLKFYLLTISKIYKALFTIFNTVYIFSKMCASGFVTQAVRKNESAEIDGQTKRGKQLLHPRVVGFSKPSSLRDRGLALSHVGADQSLPLRGYSLRENPWLLFRLHECAASWLCQTKGPNSFGAALVGSLRAAKPHLSPWLHVRALALALWSQATKGCFATPPNGEQPIQSDGRSVRGLAALRAWQSQTPSGLGFAKPTSAANTQMTRKKEKFKELDPGLLNFKKYLLLFISRFLIIWSISLPLTPFLPHSAKRGLGIDSVNAKSLHGRASGIFGAGGQTNDALVWQSQSGGQLWSRPSGFAKQTSNIALKNLILLNKIFNYFYILNLTSQKFLKQSFDVIGRFGPKSIFNFLEKPGELIIDWIAYLFLVEWSSDIANTIPENADIFLSTSYYKFTRVLHPLVNFLPQFSLKLATSQNANFIGGLLSTKVQSANIMLAQNTVINANFAILGSTFIQNRIYHLYEILLFQFYQPDTDLIIRQKKGTIFWNIWGDFLTQVAEDSNINISELTSLKEEQIKLLEKSSELSLTADRPVTPSSVPANSDFATVTSSALSLFGLVRSASTVIGREANKKGNFEIKDNFRKKYIFYKNYKFHDSRTYFGAKKVLPLALVAPKGLPIPNPIAKRGFGFANNTTTFNRSNVTNLFTKNTELFVGKATFEGRQSQAQQFLSYEGKDTELFIDLHPPKSFNSISLLKKNESVQTSIGSLVCQIFAGIMSKQISKNILMIVPSKTLQSQSNTTIQDQTMFALLPESQKNQKQFLFNNQQAAIPVLDNLSNQGKTLLIQAIAGETELKIITDSAYRYAMVYRGVAVGIKLLRDVFDSLCLHTPCLFLIEDIHAIAERRPLLISDDEKGASPSGKSVFGGPAQREEIHEKNQILYQLSKHIITHYKKPYKGDFSLLIPTNHFSFDLFSPFNALTLTNQSFSFPASKIFLKTTDNNQDSSDSSSQQVLSTESETTQSLKSQKNLQKSNNFKKSILSIQNRQLFAPPATSPFSLLTLKEDKKFKPYKNVSEMPWGGLPGEQLAQLSKSSYSIRVKVAILADMAISTLSVKLDMITDLLVIIDSVKGNRGFVVFATTHMPSILDPALRRPGRFDETITLSVFPNLIARWNVLKASSDGVVFINAKKQTQNLICFDLTNFTGLQNTQLLSSSYTPISNFKNNCLNTNINSIMFNNTLKQFYSNPQFQSFKLKQNKLTYFKSNLFYLANDFTKFTNSFNNKNYKASREQVNALGVLLEPRPYYFQNNVLNNIKQTYNHYKKQIKILSRTYFIASEMCYQIKINNFKNINTRNDKKITNNNISVKNFNFLDCFQPLAIRNMEISSFYMILYANPLEFKNYVNKLISGKIAELILLTKPTNPFCVDTKKHLTKEVNSSSHILWQTQNVFNYKYKINQFTSLDTSWKMLSSLVLSLIQKRYLYNNFNANNLIVAKFLSFNNNSSLYEAPSPPSANILLPARRYENYRRSFSFFSNQKISISITEKIQYHQQQRLVKRLYGFPVQEHFRSEVSTCESKNQNKTTNFTNATLMIGNLTSELHKPSNSNWFIKNRILMRHKNYLTNQWYNAQLPEHNAETTFLSDIDWRYCFIESIGDLLLDFPDAQQHYNPRNRRWFLTKGYYHNWFNFEKNFYMQVYTHFMFDSFIKAFKFYEQNRETLDFYAFYISKLSLINQSLTKSIPVQFDKSTVTNNVFSQNFSRCYTPNDIEILTLYKRFFSNFK